MLLSRLLASSLEVLDGSFLALTYIDDKDPAKRTAMNIATQLLTLPTPNNVQLHTKSLLASLYTNKAAYHAHKVNIIIHVLLVRSTSRDKHFHSPLMFILKLYYSLLIVKKNTRVLFGLENNEIAQGTGTSTL